MPISTYERGLIYSRPVIGIIVTGFVVWLAISIKREEGRKERELARQGFHIKYVALWRDGTDDFAINYYEPNGYIIFNSIRRADGKAVLSIPSPNAWEAKVPDWAKGRREIILKRITDARPKMIIE